MTPDESSFLTDLAADAHDYTTRLVYADWLGDHERYADELRQRGIVDGLRAMKVLGRHPEIDGVTQSFPFEWWKAESLPSDKPMLYTLPCKWFVMIAGGRPYPSSLSNGYEEGEEAHSLDFPTLTAALEACALAFSRLPAERKAELLASADSANPHFTPARN